MKRVSADDAGRRIDLVTGSLFAHTGGRPLEAAFPLVVFIHGAGQDHRVWREVADHLAAHAMSVIDLDLPGHGTTGGHPAASIEELAEPIAELIESSAHRGASLVGNSMGGLVALEVAATHPDLVERLVLVGTGATMRVNEHLLAAAADDVATANAMLDRWSHSRTVSDAKRSLSRAVRERTPPGVLHTSLVACQRYDGRRRASAVSAPTLVIVGEVDVMVPKPEVEALVDELHAARLVEIPGAGHDAMVDAPAEVIDAIERFFADHPSSS